MDFNSNKTKTRDHFNEQIHTSVTYKVVSQSNLCYFSFKPNTPVQYFERKRTDFSPKEIEVFFYDQSIFYATFDRCSITAFKILWNPNLLFNFIVSLFLKGSVNKMYASPVQIGSKMYAIRNYWLLSIS